MVKVKVCGITNMEDALGVCEAGADALGFVFYKNSPRFIEVKKAREIVNNLPPFVTTVGVFVNETAEKINKIIYETGLDVIQFHGDESPEFCNELRSSLNKRVVKAFKVKKQWSEKEFIKLIQDYRVFAYLLDTYQEGVPGGTGETFDWSLVIQFKRYGRIILAGGLNPDNIQEAIRVVRPWGVDVSSGVEERPGRKDLNKVREFIEKAKGMA